MMVNHDEIDAVQQLEKHREALIERLGVSYRDDLRFKLAVHGIIQGRSVLSVLLDLYGHGF